MGRGKMASQVARLVSPATGSTKMLSYTITLEPIENGRWRATCPLFPQCTMEAKGKNTAYQEIKRKIRSYIEYCLEHKKSIPQDKTTTKFFSIDLGSLSKEAELR